LWLPAWYRQSVSCSPQFFCSFDRPRDEGPAVHRALLGAQILIVEGLNFSRVEPGEYDLVCLPLRIRGGDERLRGCC
jgi:kynurenine formamidase